MAAIELGLAEYDRDKIHHFRLSHEAVEDVFRTLATERAEQRRHNPGLEPGRVDVIVGGVIILVTILRSLGFEEVLVSEADILDGLARSLPAGGLNAGDFAQPAPRFRAVALCVELRGFVDALQRLDGDDIRAVACAIDDHHQTVADEVAAWEAVMCIDDALRAVEPLPPRRPCRPRRGRRPCAPRRPSPTTEIPDARRDPCRARGRAAGPGAGRRRAAPSPRSSTSPTSGARSPPSPV